MSYTPNINLFKHDNPSTNTNKFDVDKAINENLDKIDSFAEQANNGISEIESRQDLLEQKYDEQIENIAGSTVQNAEVVDARKGFSTLGNVIKQKVYHFDTVSQMIACTNLENGDVVETSGYFNINDGKGTRYKIISNITGYDETNLIELNNGFYALEVDTTKYDRPFRVLLISDIHYTADDRYGVSAQKRMQSMINDIITEHKKQPIDLILILGDLSTDNMGAPNSSATLYGSNYVKRLFNEYLYKLPCPVYALPGNHDSWSNEVWKSITGYDRQYSIEFDDMIFIMLDTFNDTALNGAGATYKGIDYNFLKGELEKFKDKKIFLCAHYFYGPDETTELKNLISNNQDIIGMFCGHTHNYSEYHSSYGKRIYETGNYSCSLGYDSTKGYYVPVYKPEGTWGFREIKSTENGIITKSIRPAHTFVFEEETYEHEYTEGTATILSSSNIYRETANFHVEKDTPNNVTNQLLQELYSHVYTLKDSIIIQPNTDLNDITDIGVYMSINRGNTETLTCGEESLPWTYGGFKLINEKVTGNLGENVTYRYIRQTFIPNSSAYYGWFRMKDGNGTWSSWKKILNENDLSLKTTTVNFGTNNHSHLYFRKSGKTVTMEAQIAFEDIQELSSTWAQVTLNNIFPDGYKPAHLFEGGFYSQYTTEQTEKLFMKVYENENYAHLHICSGYIGVTLENTGSKWIYANVTYITNDI